MSSPRFSEKEAYFAEQALLDLDDDETGFEDCPAEITRAFAESATMPPPRLERQSSSFLGPTPKERQLQFAGKTRASTRIIKQTPTQATRPLELELTKRSPTDIVQEKKAPPRKKLKRNSSLSTPLDPPEVPFYKQMGVVPRELKNVKNVKLAENIKLEPKNKQLLKGRIVYFYPNDDISMVRRMRIHKIIQLGAAWVNRWSEDITHVMLDDETYSYSQLLRHLNRAGFPSRVVLVKFDPYIPQCIQFGTLLDPNAQRFAIKGAFERKQVDEPTEPSQQSAASATSQRSLQIKRSKRQLEIESSQKTESHPTEASSTSAQGSAELPASSPTEILVEDSFIDPSSNPDEEASEAATSNRFNDALSQAIREAKATAHLPLDDDDEDTETSPCHPTNGDSDEDLPEPVSNARAAPKFVSKASALRDKRLNLNTFQCMDPGNSGYSGQNPNARTIQILEEMGRHYDQMQDHWRTLAYRKGVTTLKKQKVKISTAAEAAALPFIGQRLADKIEEIVLTDRLRKLDNSRNDPLQSVLRLFLGVYGVGIVQANKWIQSGYRTLEDLKERAKLQESQKIGIEHWDDFNSRIPRAEVEAHGAVVKRMLHTIDKNFQATVMGSFRRGAKDSGDIDMIISCPDAPLSTIRTVVFDQLVPQLFKSNFLKASLATSRTADPDRSGTKWHGASCLPSSIVWRRMDFLLVPEEEMGAALIYFTGNDIFNRSIRLLARKKGMRLNQKGLYRDVQRGRRGEKLNEGTLVEGRSEKRIFEVLGVPWREPHERIC